MIQCELSPEEFQAAFVTGSGWDQYSCYGLFWTLLPGAHLHCVHLLWVCFSFMHNLMDPITAAQVEGLGKGWFWMLGGQWLVERETL